MCRRAIEPVLRTVVEPSTAQWSLYLPPAIPRSAHTVYLCALCGSQNQQRLFHYTALNDWFYNRDGECLLRGTDWVFVYAIVVISSAPLPLLSRYPKSTLHYKLSHSPPNTKLSPTAHPSLCAVHQAVHFPPLSLRFIKLFFAFSLPYQKDERAWPVKFQSRNFSIPLSNKCSAYY